MEAIIDFIKFLIVLIILLGFFAAIDSIYSGYYEKYGVINGKKFYPEGISIETSFTGKSSTTSYYYLNDNFKLLISIDGQYIDYSVSKILYDSLSKGDSLCFKYEKSILTGSILITELCDNREEWRHVDKKTEIKIAR